MATDERITGEGDFTAADPINALEYLIRSIVKRTVSTAYPCVVTAVERLGTDSGAGYVSVKPLLMPCDNHGNGLSVVSIPKLPYFRYQHGTAAIVCDPKVGDIGIAVVSKQDASAINGENTPKVPATHRMFNPSDGFYIGGFFGESPTVFVHLEDDGTIEVEAPNTVTIKSNDVVVEAGATFMVTAPLIALNGQISGGGTGGASASFTGTIHADQDITAGTVSLQGHTHSGVESGGSNTGAPNA